MITTELAVTALLWKFSLGWGIGNLGGRLAALWFWGPNR